jgi:hypothetical protein
MSSREGNYKIDAIFTVSKLVDFSSANIKRIIYITYLRKINRLGVERNFLLDVLRCYLRFFPLCNISLSSFYTFECAEGVHQGRKI